MTTYTVTTSNWNSPAFWSGISESGGGHTLDFSTLPSSYNIRFDYASGEIRISDGTATVFTIGDASATGGPYNATLGGTTELEYFSFIGGAGSDIGVGGAGDETMVGGGGIDRIAGGAGDDSIEGGAGNDRLWGGADNDSVFGQDGADSILGEGGNDFLLGQAGNDTIDGGDGNDEIRGDEGADTLYGGAGDDTLVGAHEADVILGDGGDDVFVFQSLFYVIGNDTITGGETTETAGDTVDLTQMATGATVTYSGSEAGTFTDAVSTVTFSQIENFTLTEFDDKFDASADGIGVNVDGGDGADSIRGGSGDDTLLGGAGNDTLVAGNNSGAGDSLSGGAGDDVLTDSFWNATLEGGDGSDLFNVGYGAATIDGGSGGTDEDTLSFAVADDAATVIFSADGAGVYTDDDGDSGTFAEIEALELTSGADSVDASSDSTGLDIVAGDGADTIIGGSGRDTIDGGGGSDSLTGGDGADVFAVTAGNDTITDFDPTGAGDGDATNNDFIDLSGYYDSLDELRADQADDGILNQSNALDDEGKAVDYSDNTQFSGGSLSVQGVGASGYSYDNTGIVCFAEGTLISTPRGPIAVEALRVGDMVATLEAGPQAIVWIGYDHLDRYDLAKSEAVRPILIPRGTLGARRDLFVSRQHGIRLGDRGFARAGHLVECTPGVRVAHGKRHVSYYHVLLARHHVIIADGVACESFFPGKTALGSLVPEQRDRLYSVVPGLADCRNNAQVRQVFGKPSARFLKRQRVEPSYRLWLRNAETVAQARCA